MKDITIITPVHYYIYFATLNIKLSFLYNIYSSFRLKQCYYHQYGWQPWIKREKEKVVYAVCKKFINLREDK